jgi:hypothetical protein
MTAAAGLTIMAHVGAKQFAGYALWRVERRTRRGQKWIEAKHWCGRTDTATQGMGECYALTNDLHNDYIRDFSDCYSWPNTRDAIRESGESRRMEGSFAWLRVSQEHKDALSITGALFKTLCDEAFKRGFDRSKKPQRFNPGLSKCHLATLGLDDNENWTVADIKKAYRLFAAKHHPDKGGKATDFIIVRNAYKHCMQNHRTPPC